MAAESMLAMLGLALGANATQARPPATPPRTPPPSTPLRVPPPPPVLSETVEAAMAASDAESEDWKPLAEACLARERESDLQRLRFMWSDIVLGILTILSWVGSLTAMNLYVLTRLRHVTKALTNGTGAAVKSRLLSSAKDNLEEEDPDEELVGARSVAASKAARAAKGAAVDAVLKAADVEFGAGTGRATPRGIRDVAGGGKRAVGFKDAADAPKGKAKAKPAARERTWEAQHTDEDD